MTKRQVGETHNLLKELELEGKVYVLPDSNDLHDTLKTTPVLRVKDVKEAFKKWKEDNIVNANNLVKEISDNTNILEKQIQEQKKRNK